MVSFFALLLCLWLGFRLSTHPLILVFFQNIGVPPILKEFSFAGVLITALNKRLNVWVKTSPRVQSAVSVPPCYPHAPRRVGNSQPLYISPKRMGAAPLFYPRARLCFVRGHTAGAARYFPFSYPCRPFCHPCRPCYLYLFAASSVRWHSMRSPRPPLRKHKRIEQPKHTGAYFGALHRGGIGLGLLFFNLAGGCSPSARPPAARLYCVARKARMPPRVGVGQAIFYKNFSCTLRATPLH